MPSVDIYNLDNEKVGSLDLSDDVFGEPTRKDLIWEVVRCQMARQRKGSASSKTRAQVSGTGAKPFNQKRTGRARQGTKRSPNQRGGGAAFGPHPRSFSFQVPKKVRRKALRIALSDQVRGAKLTVIQDFSLEAIKTQKLASALEKLGRAKGLLVDDKSNQNLKLSARNMPNFTFRPVEGINLVDLLRYENLVISEASIKRLEGELKP
jgi:large subunit ribosomal protein L4